jgi:hypothetical protein
MKEFIEDELYLGRTLKHSEDNVGIYPFWRDVLVNDFNFGSRIHNCVITGSLGIGKCTGRGTRIIMFDGTVKRVEDVVAGDLLMGDDSTPRQVLRTAQGRGPMFEIVPVRGESFSVNGDHILVLKSTNSDSPVEVSVNDFLKWPREKKHKACLYRVGVEWPEQPLSVDPYIMGLWLGDGHTEQTVLTTADEELADVWINYGVSLGLKVNLCAAGKESKAVSIQLSARDAQGRICQGKNQLRNKLKALGFMREAGDDGKFVQKFIPQCYLVNSRKNRLELLAGLIDTDGSKAGGPGAEGVYEITFKIKTLADQTRFLAQSLGFYARTAVKVVNSTAYYRTHISGAYELPCRLARKQSKPKPEVRVSNLTGDAVQFDSSKSRFAVVPLGEDDYFGFTLSGNGRFLLKDFTVTHNTWIMMAILLYRLVLTTMLRNPQNFFGISRGSNIIYNILSVTREVVRQTAFGDAINFMSVSPYFIKELKFDPEMEYSKSVIPLSNNIFLTAGSKGWHVLGRNVLGVALDEGNFRLEQDPDKKAYALYDQIRTRIANRFQKSEGFLPAISMIASSASDESSFTEMIIKEIERVDSPLTQKVYRQPVYKVKRHELKLGPRWFKVAHGLRNQDPFILTGWYKENGDPIEGHEVHEECPKGAKTELVPEMYWPDFKRNCRANLQAVSGISTGGSHRLFSSLITVERCIELSEAEGIVSPIKNNLRSFPMSVEDELNIWDYLVHSAFATRVQSRVVPKRHPNRLRYVHIDLATTGKAGLAICHLAGGKKVEGVVRGGEPFDEYRLVVEYDFILTIVAGQTKPINFNKICRFFLWLRDYCGFRFGLITADMYQSIMPLQTLEAAGFKVDRQSLDRDKTAYVAWRTGFEDLCIRLYRQEEMLEEAEKLMEVDKKFDHPDTGSKDTTDACVIGSTRVTCLDGRTVEIGSLAKGTKCWVFSIKPSGQVVAAEATALGTTRQKAPVLRIGLDNGQSVTCTHDHRFMLRDGTYCEARDLRVDSRLMPFYFGRTAKGYAKVFNPLTRRYEKVYNLVDTQFNGVRPKGYAVHHEDLKKTNDTPKNLKRLTSAEHWALHRKIEGPVLWVTEYARQQALAVYNARTDVKKAQAARAAYARQFSKDRTNQVAASMDRILSLAYRAKHSDYMRERLSDPEVRKKAVQGLVRASLARKKNIDVNELVELRNLGQTNREISRNLGVSESLIERRVREAKRLGFKISVCYKRDRDPAVLASKRKILDQVQTLIDAGDTVASACAKSGVTPPTYYARLRNLNHKVVSIEDAGVADVTCLQVPEFENFAVSAGVFIHNCAGAYFNAVNSEERTVLLTEAIPSIHSYAGLEGQAQQSVLTGLELPLPSRTYRTVKEHSLK